jgi:hypothetical protein
MAQDVYKLTTLNLFEDLKDTNISNSEFKEIIASYSKLGQEYIKDNQVELFKDLNKQKEIIFSYLPSFKKESLKKVAHLHKSLEAEMGNIDEIDTLQTPEKQVQFVKVAYNNGKWTISAKNFDNAEFTNKEIPDAINCLISVCDRLDEQEAAYALCHAKKAGLFTMAELPYVRTEDFNNTALETRYIKDPGTTLGPVEHSWESSVDNTNMPVSRQIASEDFQEMDSFKDEDGDIITISSVSGDAVITFDNDIYTKEEVEENISSGHWTKVEAASSDIKLKRLEKEFESIVSGLQDKLVLDEAAQRLKDELSQKVDALVSGKLEQYDELKATIEPRLKKIAAKIDAITAEDDKSIKLFKTLKAKIGQYILNYSKPLDKYQRKAVSKVEDVEALLEQARAYVSPKNLKAFEENVVNKFFYFNTKSEVFNYDLDMKNPENQEMVNEQINELKKNIKTSQDNSFLKDAAYEELDRMLINGDLNFNQYNTLSDLAEINAKPVLSSLKTIKASLKKDVRADFLGSITNVVKSLFNSMKQWITSTLTYVLGQEKDVKDLNEQLEELIQEGE